MNNFIEVTVVSDSSDPLARPRKALLRADWITSVVDISSGEYMDEAITSIGTREPVDFVNDDDEAGGVVRAERTFVVQESYQTVRAMLEAASIKG